MSDSEGAAVEGPEVAPESQDVSPDSPSATTPENSTDVAPTRKARRRPDIKPVAAVEEIPKVEERPAKAMMR